MAEIIPSVEIAPATVMEGDAIAVTYQWKTAADFRPLGRDYRVFVHVVESEGVTLFTDDHEPEPPTSTWKPGQEYRYTRTLFAPEYYPLRLRLRVGLFSGSERLSMRGTQAGKQEYEVGSVTVETRRKEQALFRFGEEWSWRSSNEHDPLRPGRWMQKPQGTILVKNPCVDALLVFAAAADPAVLGTWPVLDVSIGNGRWSQPARVREFQVFKLRVPAWAWGSDDEVPVRLGLTGDGMTLSADPNAEVRTLLLRGIALAPVGTAPPALMRDAAEPTQAASAQ